MEHQTPEPTGAEKEEIAALKERCAQLESLLIESLGYVNPKKCSPTWLKEARQAVRWKPGPYLAECDCRECQNAESLEG